MKNNTKKFINLLLLFSISGCSFLSINTSSNNSTSGGPTINPDGSVSFGGGGNTTGGTAGFDTSTPGAGYMSQDDFFASLGLKSNDKDNN